MHSKAVADQDASSLLSSFFNLGIKYTLKPLEANYRVGISRVGARILPSRGIKGGLVALISIHWPDYHQFQIPTTDGHLSLKVQVEHRIDNNIFLKLSYP